MACRPSSGRPTVAVSLSSAPGRTPRIAGSSNPPVPFARDVNSHVTSTRAGFMQALTERTRGLSWTPCRPCSRPWINSRPIASTDKNHLQRHADLQSQQAHLEAIPEVALQRSAWFLRPFCSKYLLLGCSNATRSIRRDVRNGRASTAWRRPHLTDEYTYCDRAAGARSQPRGPLRCSRVVHTGLACAYSQPLQQAIKRGPDRLTWKTVSPVRHSRLLGICGPWLLSCAGPS